MEITNTLPIVPSDATPHFSSCRISNAALTHILLRIPSDRSACYRITTDYWNRISSCYCVFISVCIAPIIITSICILESHNVGYTNLSDITAVLYMHTNDASITLLRSVAQQILLISRLLPSLIPRPLTFKCRGFVSNLGFYPSESLGTHVSEPRTSV